MILKRNEAEETLRRRSRLHEILIALINQQKDLELMEDGAQFFNGSINSECFDNLIRLI